MRKVEAVFLDDGGVMNDNSKRGPQWRKLIAEFCAPRLGGEREAWAAANEAIFWAAIDRMIERRSRGSLEADPRADWDAFTASSGFSWELEFAVGTLGLEGVFERMYGTDFVRTAKTSALYYQRMFSHAGVDPQDSVVVDDSPVALAWAREAGAGVVVLVDPEARPRTNVDAVISSLAALPVTLTAVVQA